MSIRISKELDYTNPHNFIFDVARVPGCSNIYGILLCSVLDHKNQYCDSMCTYELGTMTESIIVNHQYVFFDCGVRHFMSCLRDKTLGDVPYFEFDLKDIEDTRVLFFAFVEKKLAREPNNNQDKDLLL